ncbi:hypothetical protein EVJ58_g10005 [Rhodofomes roseus]|uniref:Uncharacterized protein n=1 Tax=Rhodofomes roseus TaxID=34475 RepID=A0A4Y9XRT6_9APHY|nr:hypothetical protein EVJ58_g10005 [Rhodofomes roseus]
MTRVAVPKGDYRRMESWPEPNPNAEEVLLKPTDPLFNFGSSEKSSIINAYITAGAGRAEGERLANLICPSNYDAAKIPENIYIKEMIPHIMQLHNEYNAFGTTRQKPKIQRKKGESSLDFVGRFAASVRTGETSRPELDVEEAIRIATSQQDALRDDVDAFHNDRDFFLATMRVRMHHHPERTPDLQGRTRKHFPATLLAQEVFQVVFEQHAKYACWDLIINGLHKLQDLREEEGMLLDSKNIYHDLHEAKVSKTFDALEDVSIGTRVLGHVQEKRLQTVIATSEPFSAHFIRDNRPEITKSHFGYPFYDRTPSSTTAPELQSEMRQRLLHFAALRCWCPPNTMYTAVISAFPEEKATLNQVLYDDIGDHAAIQELRTVFLDSVLGLWLHRLELSPTASDNNWLRKLYPLINMWYEHMHAGGTTLRSERIIPSLEYVSDKAHFEKMWEWVDSVKNRFLGGQLTGLPHGLGFSVPIHEPAPEPPRTASPAPVQQVKAPSGPTPLDLFTAEDAHSRRVSGRAYAASQTKQTDAKPKERKQGSPPPSRAALAETRAEPASKRPKEESKRQVFEVNRKTHKLFLRFVIPEEEADPNVKKGQLRWGDFEKAMTKIGFHRKEGAGSSVRFDPDEEIGGNSISFHRPHPDAILTPSLIRRVGFRLRRRFKWTAANFVQANKSLEGQQDAAE